MAGESHSGSDNPFRGLLDNLTWILPLIGVEQLVASYSERRYSDWRIGVALIVLGPVLGWITGAGERLSKRFGNLLRRVIRFDELQLRIDELQTTLNDLSETVSLQSARPSNTSPQPTVEMLEAGRREVQNRRDQRIASWRSLIVDVHRTMREENAALERYRQGVTGNAMLSGSIVAALAAGDPSAPIVHSVMELLEGDERFLTLRRRLSDKTKSVLWPPPRTVVVPPDPSIGTAMNWKLKLVLDDIDDLAKHWGID